MKQIIYRMIAISVLLSACASNGIKQPTAAQRQEEMVQIKTQLAVEYMKAADYRQAVESIDEALKVDSHYVYAWLIRAQIWQYLKEPAKAEESFRRALALEPNSAEVNNNFGWFLCDVQNRPNEAIAYFDKALSDPTYPSPQVANLNKGICTSRMGQYQMAKAYFERALAADPSFAPAQKEMARNALLAGNTQDADNLFRQYQRRIDNLSADDLLLGWKIARAMGRSQDAYEYEAQLRTNFPYSPELEQTTSGRM